MLLHAVCALMEMISISEILGSASDGAATLLFSFLGFERNCVAFKRLFLYLNHAIDLLHSNYTEVVQVLGFGGSLCNPARDDKVLAMPNAEGVFGRVLDDVDFQVDCVLVAGQVLVVAGQLTCNIFRVR